MAGCLIDQLLRPVARLAYAVDADILLHLQLANQAVADVRYIWVEFRRAAVFESGACITNKVFGRLSRGSECDACHKGYSDELGELHGDGCSGVEEGEGGRVEVCLWRCLAC